MWLDRKALLFPRYTNAPSLGASGLPLVPCVGCSPISSALVISERSTPQLHQIGDFGHITRFTIT